MTTVATKPVAKIEKLSKRYGTTMALDNISLTLDEDKVYGLLGRNGAGKTTLMSIMTAQNFPTSGTVDIFGQKPAENPAVLDSICFIRENQKYPDEATPKTVLKTAPWFFANWDEELASQLIEEFEIPLNKPMKKISRGQFSAVGATVGLASRAKLTFFDEPYLGLDAVSRDIFYRNLAKDQGEHPRTIILSSHLIDEISNLVDHVLLLDHGKLLVDSSSDELQDAAFQVTGPTTLVEEFVTGKQVTRRETLGGVSRLTVMGRLSSAEKEQADRQKLQLETPSLQELAVGLAGTSMEAKTQS